MKIRLSAAVPPILTLALAGCASTLTGVGGTDAYACKAPAGAICTSVSGVYANSFQAVPRPTKPPENVPAATTAANTSASPNVTSAVAGAGSDAIRSSPRLLRLWLAPWEDADGDLHEAAFVHMVVDPGRWRIEHVRPTPRARLAGVAPPAAAQKPAPAKPVGDEPARLPVPPAGPPDSADMPPER